MDEMHCPSCGAAVRPDSRGGVFCTGCNTPVADPFTLCPRCGRANEPGTAVCVQCETDLTAACPGCGERNWSGTERCIKCGRELDTLAHAFRPVSASFRLRQEEMRQRASSLREEGERESKARLDMLREADRRRIQRSAEMAERARQRERRIIIGTVTAVAVFIAFIILALVLIAGMASKANGG